jgi:hypothetical protein
VQRYRNLTISHLAQSARVLAGYAHRVWTFFGKAGIVNNPSTGRNQFLGHSLGKPPPHRHVIPRTLTDILLHGLDVAIRQAIGHGLNGFAFAVQKKSPDINATPVTTFSSANRLQKIFKVPLEATSTLSQLFCIHGTILQNPWLNVNYLT